MKKISMTDSDSAGPTTYYILNIEFCILNFLISQLLDHISWSSQNWANKKIQILKEQRPLHTKFQLNKSIGLTFIDIQSGLG